MQAKIFRTTWNGKLIVFILYFIFPLLLLTYIFREKLPAKTYYLYLAALAYKILAAFVMTYIQINNYDFGDLYTYFLAARETSNNMFSGGLDLAEFQRSRAASFLNAIIFLVFPPSIYGLAVLSGCGSFIYCFLLIKVAECHFEVPTFAKVLIFFLPVLSAQAGYIGKETYVLPLIGLIFLWFASDDYWRYLKIMLAVAVIAVIRPYQAAFISVALLIAWGLETNQIRRAPLIMFLLGILAMLANEEFVQMTEDLAIFGGFGDLLDVVYSGGNLILEPYPFPFSLLQSFRPFPWEAHNTFALFASIEYQVVLAYALIRGIDRLRDPFVPWHLKQKRLAVFLLVSVAVYLLVFSFNTNMGDLSRRHVYYYPFLLLVFSRPRLAAIGAPTNLHATTRPIGISAH